MKYPLAIALWLLSSAAVAYESELPPPEYDHPFPGPLTEIFMESMEAFNKVCPYPALTGYLTIAWARPPHFSTGCTIYYAPKELLKNHGVSLEHLRQHEIGHCNGWQHGPPDFMPRKHQPLSREEEIEKLFTLNAGQTIQLMFPK